MSDISGYSIFPEDRFHISGMMLPMSFNQETCRPKRRCSYCKSQARDGENCPNCGAPETVERKPFSFYQ